MTIKFHYVISPLMPVGIAIILLAVSPVFSLSIGQSSLLFTPALIAIFGGGLTYLGVEIYRSDDVASWKIKAAASVLAVILVAMIAISSGLLLA
ncbi:MAG: hypothetical protein K2X31_00460 [Sphingopyxis sp.]|nr:hypothetical protein [Sphingopyxis sp.]